MAMDCNREPPPKWLVDMDPHVNDVQQRAPKLSSDPYAYDFTHKPGLLGPFFGPAVRSDARNPAAGPPASLAGAVELATAHSLGEGRTGVLGARKKERKVGSPLGFSLKNSFFRKTGSCKKRETH